MVNIILSTVIALISTLSLIAGFYYIYMAYKGYGVQKPWLVVSGPFNSPDKSSQELRFWLAIEGLILIFFSLVLSLVLLIFQG